MLLLISLLTLIELLQVYKQSPDRDLGLINPLIRRHAETLANKRSFQENQDPNLHLILLVLNSHYTASPRSILRQPDFAITTTIIDTLK